MHASRALLVAAGLAALSPAQERRRPNVVLVMTDDQGYGDVGAHGNAMIRTPNLDALHAQSVRLVDFHVDPTCSPTRSALMSGRYSTRTGVWHTIMGRSLMDPGEVTIAEALRAAGYRTGMFGKWHLGDNYPLRPQDQGFEVALYHGGGGVGQGPDWWGNDYFDDTYFRDGTPERFEGYCTDVWFREAMRFVEADRERPFFLYLATNAPHGPLHVAEKYSKPYVDKGVAPSQAKFYGMIENIDENVGKLTAQLDRLGLADDTIFVFMTDNGTANGRVDPKRRSEGLWAGFNAGMRGHKGSEYDGGHRVPCFVRWPGGGIGGGRDVDGLCAHIDVLPTLVELCGIEKPAGPPIDGTSLAAALRDATTKLPERTLFVHSQRVPDPIQWRQCAVMTARWRLVNGAELYDILADPGQRRDVAAEHAGVVQDLRAAYEGWWRSLSSAFDRPVRIGLGSAREPTTQLHPHDWQVESQRLSSWHQDHVRRGHLGQGRWFVDVLRAGEYEFELRRWPRHVGGALDARRARLAVGGHDVAIDVAEGAESVKFRVHLGLGPTTVQTWMTLDAEKTRGAYFAYVTYRGEGRGP